MGRLFKHFPWYILLLPVFYIWHAQNSYQWLIPSGYSIQYGLFYIAIALATWLLVFLLLRDRIRAACWTGCFLLLFFFWGNLHDTLHKLSATGFFVSWTFLGLVFLLLFVALFYFLRKSRTAYLRLHQFLLLVSFAFIIVEAADTIRFFVSGGMSGNDITSNREWVNTISQSNTSNPDSLPDVFVFVFDELASDQSLKKYYGYENPASDSLLRSAGFYIAGQSLSNYNSTVHSLASFFNACYLKSDLEGKDMDGLGSLQAQRAIAGSSVATAFAGMGYRINNLGLSRLGGTPRGGEDYFDATSIAILANHTLWGRIRKQVLWKFISVPQPTDHLYNQSQDADSIHSVMQQSMALLQHADKVPHFTWAHLMITHKPFLLDRDGNKRVMTAGDESEPALRDSLYLDQVRYCRRFIDSIGVAVTRERARPAIIILLGDHGNREIIVGNDNSGNAGSNDPREKQFMNFTAVRFTGGDSTGLYPSISPVNISRLLLNRYAAKSLPPLRDSTIRMQVF